MAARHTTCRCGAPILVQLVGHRAALTARADTRLMPHHEAATLTGPNRLAWHAHRLHSGDIDLRWIGPSTHPADCTSDVIGHHCTTPPPPPRPPRKAPAQDGLFTT